MSALSHATYLAHIGRESDRLLDVLHRAGPDQSVPACPGWTPTDLSVHLMELYDVWAWSLRNRPAAIEQYPDVATPSDWPSVLDGLRAARRRFDEESRDAAPSDPCLPEAAMGATVFDVAVSLAHELLVHRYDAEQALGEVTAMDPAFAAAGVSELLLRHQPDPADARDPRRLRFVCTDTGDEVWVQYVGVDHDDELAVIPAQSVAPDAEISGPAADLLTWMWWRTQDDGAVTMTGDDELIRLARICLQHPVDRPEQSRRRWWQRRA